jgi:hypothetical protein
MSKIERYWDAVRKRIEADEPIDGDVEFSVERKKETGAREDNGAGTSTHGGAPGTASRPNYYFYRSIRYRDRDREHEKKWGIYIVRGGRNIVAARFARYFDTSEEAQDAAVEFLKTCGQAHYEFDIYAMSCEAILGRWIYAAFQSQSRQPQTLRLEDAFVVQRARQWASRHGLVDAVSSVLNELWAAENQASRLPARRLGAYLATALLEGYGKVATTLRFDHAEWVATVPDELKDECPGPHLIGDDILPVRPEACEAVELTHEQKLEWLTQRGIRVLSSANDGIVVGSVLLCGEEFPGGQFPVKLAQVAGTFTCTHSNLKKVEGLPEVVTGHVDLSWNPQLQSLGRINNYVTKIDGCLRLSGDLVTSNILGLLWIGGLEAVIDASQGMSRPADWVKTVNEFMPSGKKGVMKCQTALIKAGLKDHAKL